VVDVAGYAKAMSVFDEWLPSMLEKLREEDLLFITADHGCDPSTPSTDHSREYIPVICAGKKIKAGRDLGTRDCFSDISATVLEYLGVDREKTAGESFLSEILEED